MINFLNKGEVKTLDATATADDILNPKTAYINGQKVTGNILPTYAPTENITELNTLTTNGLNVVSVVPDNSLCMVLNSDKNIELYRIVNNVVDVSSLILITYTELGIGIGIRSCCFAKQKTDNTHIMICCCPEHLPNQSAKCTTFLLDLENLTYSDIKYATLNISDTQFLAPVEAIPNTPNQFISASPNWNGNTGHGTQMFMYHLKSETTLAINTWTVGLAPGGIGGANIYLFGFTGNGLHFNLMFHVPGANSCYTYTFGRTSISEDFVLEGQRHDGANGKGKTYLNNDAYIYESNIYRASDNTLIAPSNIMDSNKARLYPMTNNSYFVIISGNTMKTYGITIDYEIKEYTQVFIPLSTLDNSKMPVKTDTNMWMVVGTEYKSPNFEPSDILTQVTIKNVNYVAASDANALASDVLEGKVFYTATGKATGTMPTPAPITLAEYNDALVEKATKLLPGNIKAGVTIFGVTGTYTGETTDTEETT